MKRKWISCLLTLVMLVTLSPAVALTASAAPSSTVLLDNAEEIRTYLSNGGWHIVLTDDVSLKFEDDDLKVWGQVNGDCVLDLNNHEFVISNDSLDCRSSTLFEISPSASLTIKDSGKNGRIRYNSYLNERNTLVFRHLFDVKGQLTVEGGTLEAGRSKDQYVAGTGTVYWQTYGTAIIVRSGGKAVINGGTVIGRGDGMEAISVDNNGKLLVNNGFINGRGGADCLSTENKADVVLRNGSFQCNTMDRIKLEGKIWGGPQYGSSGIRSSFYDPSITTVTNNKPQYRNGSIFESSDVTVKTSATGLPDPWAPGPVPVNYTYSQETIQAGQKADITINVDRDVYKDEKGYVPVFDNVIADESTIPQGMTYYSSEADNPGIVGTPTKPGEYRIKFTINLTNNSQKWQVNHTLYLMVLNPDKISTTQTVNLKKGEHLDNVVHMDLGKAITQYGYYDVDLLSGSLPEGLDYGFGEAENPYLIGTPVETGTFHPKFLVTMYSGDQVEVSMTINVTDSSETQDPPDTPDPPTKPHILNPFVDVSESDEYFIPVMWAYYAKPQITNGMDETHFGPDLTVTRAQAVTFLWRSQGCPAPSSHNNPFVDVPSGEWYYEPVLWAVEKGITKGVDASHYNPSDTLSTQHIITFLYRTKNPGKDGWDGEAAAWAADKNGKPFGVNIAVNNTTDCPRCHVVTFLYRAVENTLSGNDFFMYIEDIFDDGGQGIIVTGRIDSGKVKTGDTIRLLSYNTENNQPVEKICSVTAIEMFRKVFDEAVEGDNVGIHLAGIQSKSELQTGDVLTGALVPMTPQTTYTGTLTLLTKEQGGRHEPIFNSYKPQIYIGRADVNCADTSGLPDAGLNPGEAATGVTITLRHPAVAYVGQELAVREGGRTVGTFTVERVVR